MRNLRMTAASINRMRSLLHMWYTPAELAGEIGVSVQWIRRYCLPAGCPHRRDETDHIWIDGQAFVDWADQNCRRHRRKLEPGQAWCMRCMEPVDMVGDLTATPTNRILETVQGECAKCGGNVSRARKRIHDQP